MKKRKQRVKSEAATGNKEAEKKIKAGKTRSKENGNKFGSQGGGNRGS